MVPFHRNGPSRWGTLLLPVWAGLVMAAPRPGLARRLAYLASPVLGLAVALAVLAGAAGEDGLAGAVLRAHAAVLGFAVLLAGLAAMLGRIAGPRTARSSRPSSDGPSWPA